MSFALIREIAPWVSVSDLSSGSWWSERIPCGGTGSVWLCLCRGKRRLSGKPCDLGPLPIPAAAPLGACCGFLPLCTLVSVQKKSKHPRRLCALVSPAGAELHHEPLCSALYLDATLSLCCPAALWLLGSLAATPDIKASWSVTWPLWTCWSLSAHIHFFWVQIAVMWLGARRVLKVSGAVAGCEGASSCWAVSSQALSHSPYWRVWTVPLGLCVLSPAGDTEACVRTCYPLRLLVVVWVCMLLSVALGARGGTERSHRSRTADWAGFFSSRVLSPLEAGVWCLFQ